MTARKPAVRPLCGRCESGWVYDDETGTTARCPCRRPQATPEAERDAALDAVAEAHPQAMRDALRIIRDTALAMPEFSSNNCRAEMNIADIPGPVRGRAFRQAAVDKLIRSAGYIASDQAETHGHPVKSYESLVFGHGAVAS